MNKKYIAIVGTAVLLSNILTYAFTNSNYVQVPFVITTRPLIVPRKQPKKLSLAPTVVAKIPKPTPTAKPQFEEAFDTVWFNESNRGNDKTGLHGECLAQGKINEIGFAPHERPIICFKDRKEQKDTFMLWLNNRLNHVKTPYCNTVKECILFYTNQAYTI